jgi:uncharacterized protein YkwD
VSLKQSFTLVSLMSLFFTLPAFAKEPLVVIISLDDISFPLVINEKSTTSGLDPTKQKYLDAINQARSQTQDCGSEGIKEPVPALKWNDKLYDAAYMHSNDLAETDTFSHTGSGTQSDIAAQRLHPGVGSTVTERIEYTGYVWSRNGENIAAGYGTMESTMIAWLNSPGHCANIMSPNFKEVGMALVIKTNSQYYDYWTQDFGTAQ